MAEALDWSLAVATGVRTAGRGPQLSMTDAAAAVAALRAAAERVRDPVAAITGLVEHDTGPAAAVPAVAAVVDRSEWIQSNVDALRGLVAPLTPATSGPLHAVGSRLAALQLGVALGWLSGKVLGQFEVLPGSNDSQRLLLVAPNITAAADELDADADDFRTWVCLHEETHRLQFAANPWLTEYFRGEVTAIVADLDIGVGDLVTRLASGLRRGGDATGIAGIMVSDEARSRMSGLTALMSLLEGHADWVMDSAGDLVPTAPALRDRFEARRRSHGVLDTVIRRLLGLEAKMAQYRDGAAFVRAVVADVGLADFNRIWTSPATLPLAGEIARPEDWVTRVLSR